MAKKQKKQEEATPQEIPQPIRQELSDEEKELIKAATRLALAKRRKGAIMVTLPTLTKQIEMMLPLNIDFKMLMGYVRELVKDKITTLHDRIGEDILKIEAVLLYSSIEELLEEFQKKHIDVTIKIVDAGLDSIADYKQ
jgi:hypothetical protein